MYFRGRQVLYRKQLLCRRWRWCKRWHHDILLLWWWPPGWRLPVVDRWRRLWLQTPSV